MIKKDAIERIKKELKGYDTYNIRFQYNGVLVTLSFNNLLDWNSSFIIHLQEINSSTPKIYVDCLKYKEPGYLKFDVNKLGYRIEDENEAKITKDFFIGQLITDGKLSDFWNQVNLEIKKGNYFKRKISTYCNINNYSTKEKGIYLANEINKQMTNEHLEYLKVTFNIPKRNLRILQRKGITIATTNDLDKSLKYMNRWLQYRETWN